MAFHFSIHFAEELFFNRAIVAPGGQWIVWGILTPALGGLAAGILLKYVVPNARGSGVPQVKVAYASRDTLLRLRDSIGKLVIASACGVFPDGTPFNIPDDDRPPPALELAATVRDTRAYLAIPIRRLGETDVGAEQREGLARLDAQFLDFVAQSDPALANHLGPVQAYRQRYGVGV